LDNNSSSEQKSQGNAMEIEKSITDNQNEEEQNNQNKLKDQEENEEANDDDKLIEDINSVEENVGK